MRATQLSILALLLLVLPFGCELWSKGKGTVTHIAIGISYSGTDVQPLGAPPNDAHCLSKAFENLYSDRPFHRIVLVDEDETNPLNKQQILEAIDTVLQALTPLDLLIISYSGHGLADGSWVFLPPEKDQRIIDTEGVVHPSLLLGPEELFALLSGCPAAVLLLCDACYSGNFINESDSSVSTIDGRPIFADAYHVFFSSGHYAKEVFVMAATSKDNSSYEPLYGSHTHGYFTSALLEGLGWECKSQSIMARPGLLTADGLYRYILEHQYPPTKSGGGLWYQHPVTVGGPLDLVLINR